MSDTLPQSRNKYGTATRRMVYVTPEDLASLATQIVQGLHAQLGLEQLLQAQEQRLLAAMSSVGHSSSTKSPAQGTSPIGQKSRELSRINCMRTADGPSHNKPERHHLKATWGSEFPWAASSGVARLGEDRDSELLATVQQVREDGGSAASRPSRAAPPIPAWACSDMLPFQERMKLLSGNGADDADGDPTNAKQASASRRRGAPANRRYTVGHPRSDDTSPEEGAKEEHDFHPMVRKVASERQASGRKSLFHRVERRNSLGQLKGHGKSNKEVLALMAEPPPLPAEPPAPAGGSVVLAGMMARFQQLSSRCNARIIPEERANLDHDHSLDDQPTTSIASLPDLAQAASPNQSRPNQSHSLADDLLLEAPRPEEKTTEAAAASVAAEEHPHGGSPGGHGQSGLHQLPALCQEAEHGGTADVAAAASACQHPLVTPPATADRPAPQQGEKNWLLNRRASASTLSGESSRSSFCKIAFKLNVFTSEPSETRALQLEREEELLSVIGRPSTPTGHRVTPGTDERMSRPCTRNRQISEALKRTSSPERNSEPARSSSKAVQLEQDEDLRSETSFASSRRPLPMYEGTMSSPMGTSDSVDILSDTLSERLEELDAFSEGPAGAADERYARTSPCAPATPKMTGAYCACVGACVRPNVGSPLLLRLCGILPWGRFAAPYHYWMLVLAAGLAAFFVAEFVRAQGRIASPTDCPVGICLSFGYLSDMVLSVGSLLGLVAMRALVSLDLLGTPTALLVRFAVEHDVVTKWSNGTSWQSVYLGILWVGSLAFRARAMQPSPDFLDVVRASAFVLSTLIFMGLVFSILHVSCVICSLLDNYAQSIRVTRDIALSITEWDRLVALVRRVSRALDRGFLLVQATAVAILLCSFSELVLQGATRTVWQFISNVLLTQSLVLLFSKAAEVTGYCTRLPPVVNSLDFGGDAFSAERHYLVEHITYSAAGFHVGDVRLTAGMALKLMHVSIVAALGILTKLTMA